MMRNLSTKFTTILLTVFCFALSPIAQAVSPPPDGGYSGGNTAEGQSALLSLTTGGFNTAVGYLSLRSNTTGQFNTALGAGTLLANTGDQNTAIGAGALFTNTADGNTAVGSLALFNNTFGFANTANGEFALFSNTTGSFNTATGGDALGRTTVGSFNTANGFDALNSNTGNNNTGVGFQALYSNTTGSFNTAVGVSAGSAQTVGSNNIYIGDTGENGESNTIRIGNLSPYGTAYQNFFVGGVYGVTTISGTTLPVLVSDTGQLGTAPSAGRFKKEIRPMDKVSESVLALKPVTFHYKSDNTNTPQFGLIAEEVAAVNPDLVVRDKSGEIYSVRYDEVNAMLLNEFLKEHRKVQELEANAARQQKQIEALAAGLQTVSAQLELNKPVPRTVLNNQ